MMRRTNRRMALCIVLLVLNLAFIWGNSLLPGSLSGSLSQWVQDCIRRFLPGVFPPGQSDGGILRKMAHYSEFCLLGAVLGWLFGMVSHCRIRRLSLPLFFGFLTACVDETIQRFVPGRYSSPIDVCIDTSGVITGILFFSIGYYLYHKRH